MKIIDYFLSCWHKMLLWLLYCLIVTIMCACAWYTIAKINAGFGTSQTESSKVVIDVCISDSLSKQMNDNIKHAIKVLEKMESDSIDVEVSKIHK